MIGQVIIVCYVCMELADANLVADHPVPWAMMLLLCMHQDMPLSQDLSKHNSTPHNIRNLQLHLPICTHTSCLAIPAAIANNIPLLLCRGASLCNSSSQQLLRGRISIRICRCSGICHSDSPLQPAVGYQHSCSLCSVKRQHPDHNRRNQQPDKHHPAVHLQPSHRHCSGPCLCSEHCHQHWLQWCRHTSYCK